MPYYLNATSEQLRHLFRSRKRGQVYTAPERRLSLYLDVDDGHSKSLRGYSEQWGAPNSTLQREWQDITRGVWDQCTSDGRQWTNQAERYLELAGLAYDDTIPPRRRTAMQSRETYRPDPETVCHLQGLSRVNRGSMLGQSGSKTGPDDGTEAAFGSMVGQSGSIAGQYPNTSIPSTPSISGDGGGSRAGAREGPEDRLSDAREMVDSDTWERHGQAIERMLAEFPPGSEDRLYRRVCGEHADGFGLSEVAALTAQHGSTAVVAALTLTGLSKPKGDRTLAYTKGIITRITNEHAAEKQNGKPAGTAPPGRGHANGHAPGGRRRGGPAEAHTFDGARRIAERAMQRYDELFGDGREGGGAGGDQGDQ